LPKRLFSSSIIFAAFLYQACYVRTGLARWLFPERLENLFESIDMALGLFKMAFKTRANFFRLGRFGHFRQSHHQTVFHIVKIAIGGQLASRDGNP
jgi:hypothetical protein